MIGDEGVVCCFLGHAREALSLSPSSSCLPSRFTVALCAGTPELCGEPDCSVFLAAFTGRALSHAADFGGTGSGLANSLCLFRRPGQGRFPCPLFFFALSLLTWLLRWLLPYANSSLSGRARMGDPGFFFAAFACRGGFQRGAISASWGSGCAVAMVRDKAARLVWDRVAVVCRRRYACGLVLFLAERDSSLFHPPKRLRQ